MLVKWKVYNKRQKLPFFSATVEAFCQVTSLSSWPSFYATTQNETKTNGIRLISRLRFFFVVFFCVYGCSFPFTSGIHFCCVKRSRNQVKWVRSLYLFSFCWTRPFFIFKPFNFQMSEAGRENREINKDKSGQHVRSMSCIKCKARRDFHWWSCSRIHVFLKASH